MDEDVESPVDDIPMSDDIADDAEDDYDAAAAARQPDSMPMSRQGNDSDNIGAANGGSGAALKAKTQQDELAALKAELAAQASHALTPSVLAVRQLLRVSLTD